ncbi:MAG: ADOP family duplicated permease, partial [Gemmatimonadales bacterium]
MIGRWLRAARLLLGRRRFEREMDEELAFHLERQEEDLVRGGVAPAEARRRARAMFGAVDGFKEDAREASGIAWLGQLRSDFGFALRTLRRSPGYALAAIGTLGLGIGANTTIFGVIDGVLLRPLPFPESGRLVRVGSGYPAGAVLIYRAEARSYQAVGTYGFESEFNLLVGGEPERIAGRSVSAEFFDVLGARAALGRTFYPGEDQAGADLVAVISDQLWRRRFGADAEVIGRTLTLDGRLHEIVGVMPRGFEFPISGTELWVTLPLDPTNPTAMWASAQGTTFIGRLRPEVTVPMANAEHRALITRVRDGFPWRMPDEFGQEPGNRVLPLAEAIGERVEDRLLLLLGAVGLVLLVACANVANLNLTRIAAREREFAVRRAIGGSRGRIGRQVLVEQLVLATLGGALGVGLAAVGTPLLVHWLPAGTPRLDEVGIDARVLLFTGVLVLLAAGIAALAPTLRTAGIREAAALGSARRSAGPTAWGRRFSNALVVSEVAVASILLIGAGLLMRSLKAVLERDPGVRVERIVTARITQDAARCDDSMGSCAATFLQIEEALARIPGVSGAAIANMLPLDGQVNWFAMHVEGHPVEPGEPAHILNELSVSPGYFRIAGIRLEEGRLFDANDDCSWRQQVSECRRGAMVAVVSRSLADRYWPGESAIGKTIRPVWLAEWSRVVGVVSDVRQESLSGEPAPTFYWPLGQWGTRSMTAMLESALPAPVLEPEIRRAVASVDPVTPVSRIQSMEAIVAGSVASSRTSALLIGVFAGSALLLGAIGVYGVLSYGVSSRRQEIGVRLAVGAAPGRVMGMVVGQALLLVAVGL